jgi:hypothetical protein
LDQQAVVQDEIEAEQIILRCAQQAAVETVLENSLPLLRRAGQLDLHQEEIQAVQQVALRSVQQDLVKFVQENGLHAQKSSELPYIHKLGLYVLKQIALLTIKQITLKALKRAVQQAVQRKTSGPSSSREWRQHQTFSTAPGPSGVQPAKMPRLTTQEVRHFS